MARPQKIGLDYFPLDVDMDQDDKVYLIKAEHGYEGFGIVVKLFMEIYKQGYFMEWNDKKAKIFAHKHAIELETLRNVIDICLDEKLFNKEKYTKYGVLTSKGIQERYLEATSRRGKVIVHKQYMLVEVNADKNDSLVVVNVDKNPNSSGVNDGESTQSKGNKKKQDNKREEEKEDTPPPEPPKEQKVKFLDSIKLKPSEYEKLCESYGKSNVDKKISDMNDYINAKGKKYKSHYHALNLWIKKDIEQGNLKKKSDDQTEIDFDKAFERFEV